MVVGLEVHVQLRTRTKLFCNCSTQFGDPPNRNTCPVCLALPGSLPVLNESAVELATRAALALDASRAGGIGLRTQELLLSGSSKGLPDLAVRQAAGHSTATLVIGEHADGSPMRVRITRVHMEEDAGKSIHDRYAAATSAIDLNRAGTPLIEIVSEPDIRSAAEAGSYLRLLKQVLEYVDVSDSEHGGGKSPRRREHQHPRAWRDEARHEDRGEEHEFVLRRRARARGRVRATGRDRGIARYRVEQETLLWDADRGAVRPARSKEGSHDYRYFPDPDLPPLRLTKEWIARIRDHLPELPDARRRRFATEYRLGTYDIDVLTANPRIAEYFEAVARAHGDAKTAANWVMGEVLAVAEERRCARSTGSRCGRPTWRRCSTWCEAGR